MHARLKQHFLHQGCDTEIKLKRNGNSARYAAIAIKCCSDCINKIEQSLKKVELQDGNISNVQEVYRCFGFMWVGKLQGSQPQPSSYKE